LSADEMTNNTEKVIAYSREMYASERTMVEEKIMRWHESYNDEPEPVVKKNLANGPYAPTSRPPFVPNIPTINVPQQVARVGASAQYKPAPVITQPQVQAAPVAPVTPVAPLVPVAPVQAPAPILKETAPIISQQTSTLVKTSVVYAKPTINKPKVIPVGYPAICSNCGKETTTIFVPDGVRPVYCKECLSLKKEEKRIEAEKRQIAKVIERKHLEEDDGLINEIASMSLSSLTNAKPVDFHGREIKTKPRVDATVHQNEEEHDLKEGEEIEISNNQF